MNYNKEFGRLYYNIFKSIMVIIFSCYSTSIMAGNKPFILEVRNVNGMPIEGVNVCVYNNQNQAIYNATSSTDGKVEFDNNIFEFPIIITLTHISYISENLYVHDNHDISNLGIITMQYRNVLISEINISAEKPLMYFQEEALVVNVSNNTSLNTKQLDKIIKTLPGIIIDNNNQISLFGNDVSIYIDGVKQQSMSMEMLNKLLRTVSGSMIEEVELSSNSTGKYGTLPGSSYINIRTKELFNNGYLLSIHSNGARYIGNNFGGGGEASLLFSSNNFKLRSIFAYEHTYEHNLKNRETICQGIDVISQSSNSFMRENAFVGNVNALWVLPKNYKININLQMYDDFSRHRNKENVETKSIDYLSENIVKRKYSGNDDLWAAYFSFSSPDSLIHTINLYYSYVYGGIRQLKNHFSYNYEDNPSLNYDAKMNGYIHETNLSYAYKYNHHHSLNMQFKLNVGRLKDNVTYDNMHNDNNNQLIGHETDLNLNFVWKYKINDSFSMFSELGTNYTNYCAHVNSNKAVSRQDFTILPYFHLRYVSKSRKYRTTLAFISNKNLPNYEYMLPGKRIVDSNTIIQGCSDIKSQQSYGITIQQYLLSFINVTLGYKKIKNMSGPVYIYDEGNTIVSYNNYADENRLYGIIQIPYYLIKKAVSGNLSFSTAKHSLINMRNGYYVSDSRPRSYWTSSIQLYSDFKLSSAIGVSTSANYYFGYKTHQIDVCRSWSLDLGAYLNILKNNRLSVNIDVEDVFNSRNQKQTLFYGPNSQKIKFNPSSSIVRLGLIWQLSNGHNQEYNLPSNQIDTSRFNKE